MSSNTKCLRAIQLLSVILNLTSNKPFNTEVLFLELSQSTHYCKAFRLNSPAPYSIAATLRFVCSYYYAPRAITAASPLYSTSKPNFPFQNTKMRDTAGRWSGRHIRANISLVCKARQTGLECRPSIMHFLWSCKHKSLFLSIGSCQC